MPDWPRTGEEPLLEKAALGPAGLVNLMLEGTDDDPGAEPPGLIDSVGEVDFTVRKIIRRSATSVTKITAGVTAAPLVGALPLQWSATVAEAIHNVLEQVGEWAIEETIERVLGRISILVRAALKRVKRLISTFLGRYVTSVSPHSEELINEGVAIDRGAREVVYGLMWRLYKADAVIDDAAVAFVGLSRNDIRARAARLRKLERSNERWVGPIEIISKGIGPLWRVPIPLGPFIIPAGPVAAAVMLAWVVLISGDQLDRGGIYPNVWKGVVRRSQGE
ncbi:MAG: hypothetical protein ABI310_09315 [Microbacteriaceae bacterium]